MSKSIIFPVKSVLGKFIDICRFFLVTLATCNKCCSFEWALSTTGLRQFSWGSSCYLRQSRKSWKYQEGERGQTENVTKLEGKANVLEIPTGVFKTLQQIIKLIFIALFCYYRVKQRNVTLWWKEYLQVRSLSSLFNVVSTSCRDFRAFCAQKIQLISLS